ncbi:MAG TPA: pyridoxal-phosphate dependent enzyme [Candidatus Saccharimonadales bacterium]|nr:pyridoxal-phosphate dependent enzyme [Candidatus Saccharimonadales bacterium]
MSDTGKPVKAPPEDPPETKSGKSAGPPGEKPVDAKGGKAAETMTESAPGAAASAPSAGTADARANGAAAGERTNGEQIEILDAQGPSTLDLELDLTSQQKIAVDRSLPVERRVEAFEDIVESDVGDTSLSRARNLEREIGLRQIYLKFEGDNPTGTQKDRIAFIQARDALRRGYDTITVATCGNYGAAVALAASLSGLRCVVYVPETYHTRRQQEIEQLGAAIVRVPTDYEGAVALSQERAAKDEFYDANPGGANTSLQLRAYGEIAYEIYDELRDAPAAVAVPVSNGTTLAGIYRGFLSLYRRGRTSRFPRMIAGSSARKNPIVNAWEKALERCEDLDPKRIHETSINEPLINWRSLDGDHALEAVRRTLGWAGGASDKEMTRLSRMIREKQGHNVLPASTAGFAVLLEHHARASLPGDRYVVVLTGRKS